MKLTKGEKVCFSKLQKLDNEIIYYTIDEISAMVHYSPATINRTIKKMGYKNLKEYKSQYNYTKYKLKKSENIYDQELINLINLNQDFEFKIIFDSIKHAENIYVIGIGASGGVCVDFVDGLNKMGYNAMYFLSGASAENMIRHNVRHQDLIFFITYSGIDEYLIRGVKFLNKFKNCKFFTITATPENYIAKNSTLAISSKFDKADLTFRGSAPLAIMARKLLIYIEQNK